MALVRTVLIILALMLGWTAVRHQACEFRGHVARDSGKLSPGIPGLKSPSIPI